MGSYRARFEFSFVSWCAVLIRVASRETECGNPRFVADMEYEDKAHTAQRRSYSNAEADGFR